MENVNGFSLAWRIVALVLLLINVTMVSRQNIELNNIKTQLQFLQGKTEAVDTALNKVELSIDSLWKIHPIWKKMSRTGKVFSSNYCVKGTFLGFVLYTRVDTTICPKFKDILSTYNGPKVRLNSLRRHNDRGSRHYRGQAVDLELKQDLVEFLISDEGQHWLNTHNLMFYIEGNPRRKTRVKQYEDGETGKYVFWNRRATGDHIHLALKA